MGNCPLFKVIFNVPVYQGTVVAETDVFGFYIFEQFIYILIGFVPVQQIIGNHNLRFFVMTQVQADMRLYLFHSGWNACGEMGMTFAPLANASHIYVSYTGFIVIPFGEGFVEISELF